MLRFLSKKKVSPPGPEMLLPEVVEADCVPDHLPGRQVGGGVQELAVPIPEHAGRGPACTGETAGQFNSRRAGHLRHFCLFLRIESTCLFDQSWALPVFFNFVTN